MELYGCSFQAPHCLTWTWTDGNTLCSLIHISTLGTLSCQNLTRIIQEIVETFQHLFKCYEIHMHNHPVNSIQY